MEFPVEQSPRVDSPRSKCQLNERTFYQARCLAKVSLLPAKLQGSPSTAPSSKCLVCESGRGAGVGPREVFTCILLASCPPPAGEGLRAPGKGRGLPVGSRGQR